MEGAWAVLQANGRGLGGAISKWKGSGRCYKQMEGTWAALYAKKGPGRCYKQMEGAWAAL